MYGAIDAVRFNAKADDLLVCGDIKSMFTLTPRSGIRQWIEEELPSQLENLLAYFSNTTFSFYGVKYRQVRGLYMGSRVSPLLAVGFVEYSLRSKLKIFTLPFKVIIYVDDICLRITRYAGGKVYNIVKQMEICLDPMRIVWSESEVFSIAGSSMGIPSSVSSSQGQNLISVS